MVGWGDAAALLFTCRLLTERGLRRSRCVAGCGGAEVFELESFSSSLTFSGTLWKTKSVKRRFVWWRADWISEVDVSYWVWL